MTLTERMEFKDLKELQNLKSRVFRAMKKAYGKGMTYALCQSDINYYHIEFDELYTTGTEKDCYQELLEHIEKKIEEE